MNRATLKILAAIALLPLVCLAGTQDRRHKSGDGLNNDGAAYWGDQKSQQWLTPDMIMHYTQAQMYFMQGNVPMGEMEQMKGDMLKQQIDENKKSADKNRQNEKLLTDENDPTGQQLHDPNVITVDKDRLPQNNGGGSSGPKLDSPSQLSAPAPAAPVTPATSNAALAQTVQPDALRSAAPEIPASANAPLGAAGGKAIETTDNGLPQNSASTSTPPTTPATTTTGFSLTTTKDPSDGSTSATATNTVDWKKDLDTVVQDQNKATGGADGMSAQTRLLLSPPKKVGAADKNDDSVFASVGKPRKDETSQRSRRSSSRGAKRQSRPRRVVAADPR